MDEDCTPFVPLVQRQVRKPRDHVFNTARPSSPAPSPQPRRFNLINADSIGLIRVHCPHHQCRLARTHRATLSSSSMQTRWDSSGYIVFIINLMNPWIWVNRPTHECHMSNLVFQRKTSTLTTCNPWESTLTLASLAHHMQCNFHP